MQAADQVLFAHVVSRADDSIDLIVAALLVALYEYPALDVGLYSARIDDLVAGAEERLDGDNDEAHRVEVLATWLFQELGFRGNCTDYYDPRNSFLNDVLDRRLGAPITLSIILAEVGRRVGLPLAEISFPGHFMVLYEGRLDSFVVDPFNGGAKVSIAELGSRLKNVLGPSAELTGEYLRRATKQAIIFRLLNNLAAIYRRGNDLGRAIAVLERQCILGAGNIRVENELADLRRRLAERN